MLRLLVAAMSVMLALLASFGTIVAFFSFTTSSYPFIVLFNVVVFSLSGFLGLTFLLRTLHRLTVAQWEPETVEATTNEPVSAAEALFDIVDTDEVDMSADSATPPPLPSARAVKPAGALDAMEQQRLTRDVKTVFQFWIIIFGLVGAQMSWVLRPFIGGGKEFALFRERGGNFFESVASSFSKLFGL